MNLIFLSLVVWNTLFFVATIVIGTIASGDAARWHVWHFTVGILTGIFTCLTHSVVMIHFMGSGKGVKEAVENFNLPDDPRTGFVRRTKKFKARTSGLATLAAFAVIVTTWFGAAFDTNRSAMVWHYVHQWISYFAVLFNIYAFWVEYRVIKENTVLIAEVNALIEKANSAPKEEWVKKN